MLLGGRWHTGSVLPAPEGLARGEAWEREPQDALEWFGLDVSLAARPDLVDGFERVQDAVAAAGPCRGLVGPMFRDGHRVIRPRIRSQAISGLVLPDTMAHLRAVAGALWPAMVHVSEALLGTVRSRDLAIAAAGHLVVAPSGLVVPRAQWAADPYRSPSTSNAAVGMKSDVAFCFGLLLAEMISGESAPFSSRDVFVRNATQDPEVCAALIELTSDVPARRLAMANSLVEASGGEPFDARPFLHAKPVEVPICATPERKQRARSPALVMGAADLAAIEPPKLERLAAITGVPAAFLEQLQSTGEPVVLAQCKGVSQVKQEQRSLREAGFSTEVWRDINSQPSSRLRAVLGMFVLASPGVAAVVYGGPAVGAAVGTLGLALGALLAGKHRSKRTPPRVWNPPSFSEPAVEVARATRRRLVGREVSAIGAVLLREALDDLENALVDVPQDEARVDLALRSLRTTLGHVIAAEDEASRTASSDHTRGKR